MKRPFIGREEDLEYLHSLFEKRVGSFVVIRGRRRIGKSRLIEEFGKAAESYVLTGVPPTEETTRQGQLDEFASLLTHDYRHEIRRDTRISLKIRRPMGTIR